MDYDKRLEKELERIRESEDLADVDREALLRYRRDLEAKGLRKSRFYKLLVQTRMCAERLDGKSLVEATEGDVKNLVMWVQNRDLASFNELLMIFFSITNHDNHLYHVFLTSTPRWLASNSSWIYQNKANKNLNRIIRRHKS